VGASVAIIPARKGSITFPNKNLAKFQGKTLIEHAVQTARESNIFASIILTSDYTSGELAFSLNDNEILHTRSDFSASSSADASDVLRDLFDCFECLEILSDASVCYLQPTSPLRTSRDIADSQEIAENSFVKRCVSVSSKPIVSDKLMALSHDLMSLSELHTGFASSNRQDGRSLYLPNGAIYWFEYQDFLREQSFPLEGAAPYFMNVLSSIDIDQIEDLDLAQKIVEVTHG
jgi:CMP-N-acetylneuraminic acid synthetase